MAAIKPDWDAIKNEYVTTRIGQRALAEKYGVPLKTLSGHATSDAWVAARERYRHKVGTKAIEKAADKASEYKSRIYDIAYKMAAQLDEAVERGMIAEYGWKPRDVTGALKDITDILAIKSEADAREQEARINKLVKDAEREDEGGKEVVVRIEGANDTWAQ